MTVAEKSMAVMVVTCFLVAPGCGQREQKQKSESATDHAQTAVAREDSAAENMIVAEAVEAAPAAKHAESPPADPQPVVTPEISTPEAEPAKTPAAVEAAGLAYIGAKKCKMCHMKQFTSWAKTGMATTFEKLKPGVAAAAKKKVGFDPDKDYTHDASCLKCHTTGYGKPGGFVNLETTPEMINVQCESCHGPGIEYDRLMRENKDYTAAEAAAAGLLRPSHELKNCLRCHGEGNPFIEAVDARYAFHFEERLARSHENFPMKRQH